MVLLRTVRLSWGSQLFVAFKRSFCVRPLTPKQMMWRGFRAVSRAASTVGRNKPPISSTSTATLTAGAARTLKEKEKSTATKVLDVAFKATVLSITGYSIYMMGFLGSMTYELLHRDDDPDAPPQFLMGPYYFVYGPRFDDLGAPVRKITK